MANGQRNWVGLKDGPFPRVATRRELKTTEREWLITNGSGAYSMSTLSLMHTRRYHGVLVAALDPPIGRYVMLSHAETTLDIGAKTYRLSTHQFPGVAPTPGYRLLDEFAMDPAPRWVYRLPEGRFERTISLVQGRNAVVLSYTWFGQDPARLSVRPLLPLRRSNALTREHGGMVQEVVLRPGVVVMRPRPEVPALTFQHDGVFVGSPDWWRRFEYLADVGQHDDIQEDLWSPGVFEVPLQPRHTMRLMAAVGDLSASSLEELRKVPLTPTSEGAPDVRGSSEPKVKPAVAALLTAAAAFRCTAPAYPESEGPGARGRPGVVSGYPWHDAVTRDALIALPGLYLVTGHASAARDVLTTLARLAHAGFLPAALPPSSERRGSPCPDASLWLFRAAAGLVDCVGEEDPFVRRTLYPMLLRVFLRVRGKHRKLVWLSSEGLVANGSPGRALTWMNAAFGKKVFTARDGLAVEHQALWALGCRLLKRLGDAYADARVAAAADTASQRLKASFARRFWCQDEEYPFDRISELSGRPETWTDKSIRPNAVIALALAPELFEEWQARAILQRARSELLTSRGLRTLAPTDPSYAGGFLGDPQERESSTHQGCAWPFLLGFFAQAVRGTGHDDEALRGELVATIEAAADDGLVLGHIAEFADGDPPGRPHGCPASALSAAELLRALLVDLAQDAPQ